MLLSFKVKNYRSFRDEVIFDFEAVGLNEYKECLIKYNKNEYLPVGAIFGKNGAGKSNLIRALWLAVQFIKNAQRTQHENATVPVSPFLLNEYSLEEPSCFEFNYVYNNVKYTYGFSATRQKIITEYLYYAPKGKKSKIFNREEQEFYFPENVDKKMKELISNAVAPNQLYFAVSCTMNYEPCKEAMQWFRNFIVFSRDYMDLGKNIIDYQEDKNMLKSMVNMAKISDLGIEDISFEINNIDITDLEKLPKDLPVDLKDKITESLARFNEALEKNPNESESMLKLSEIKIDSYHKGEDKNYSLPLEYESDGTRRLMVLAPAIEKAIQNGGIFIIDDIEGGLHPILVEYIIDRFQDKRNNANNAQLIFTTHNIEILGRELLRRDQIYFVDKGRDNGVSELYSLVDYSPRKDENIYKAYILGKYGAIPILEDV